MTPWTVAHQTPLLMGFSRQEYWNGLPFPLPRQHPTTHQKIKNGGDADADIVHQEVEENCFVKKSPKLRFL